MRTARRALVRGLVALAGPAMAAALAVPAAQADPRTASPTASATASATASVTGGDAIYGRQYQCTAAVNVTNGSAYFILTLGYCGGVESDWYTADGSYIGPTAGSSFPDGNSAIIAYVTDVAHPGTIGTQDVTSAGDAYLGERVCARNQAAGVVCGETEVTTEGGPYAGLCADADLTGAPLYDGTTVLGIVTDSVAGGCGAHFEPITGILATWGVSIY